MLARRQSYAACNLWWLNPGWIVLAILVPLYLSYLAFDFSQAVPVAYLPSGLYYWGLALLLTVAIGAGFGMQIDMPSRRGSAVLIPRWVPAVLLSGTLTAYIVWFHPLALRPQLVLQVLTAERANVRDEISTMPPLTTLTQWGVAYVITYAIRRGEGQALSWERAGMWLVVLFALLRSIVWNERLALLEVLFCYGIATLASYRFTSAARFRGAGLLPLVAPFVLYLGFTATEYFRSWSFYRHQYDSIWRFAYDRLAAYYAIATNNGIGLLVESHRWPSYDGSFVFQWLHPRPPSEASNFLLSAAQYDYQEFLTNFARPELNNPSGLFVIVYDVGYLGSTLYFLLVGTLIGIAYRAFRLGRLGGVLFYPACVLFLIELPRFNYFAASRFVPIALALLLVVSAAHRLHRRTAPHLAGLHL